MRNLFRSLISLIRCNGDHDLHEMNPIYAHHGPLKYFLCWRCGKVVPIPGHPLPAWKALWED